MVLKEIYILIITNFDFLILYCVYTVVKFLDVTAWKLKREVAPVPLYSFQQCLDVEP